MRSSKHRQSTLRVCLALGLSLALFSGCLGPKRVLPEPRMVAKEPEAPPPPPKPVQAAAASTPAPAPSKDADPSPASKPMPSATASASATATPAQAPAALPKNLAEWTNDDFVTARSKANQQLVQAVMQRINSSPADDEATVQLFIELIHGQSAPRTPAVATAAAADSDDEDAPAPQTLTQDALARQGAEISKRVIPYLIASECPEAKTAVEQLVRGKLRTDLRDVEVIDLALRSMASQYARYEELLFSMLTQCESWRSEAKDPPMAEELQQKCLKIIQPLASSGLRTRLAKHLVDPSTPPAHREVLGPLLAAAEEANLNARVILHNSGLLSPQKVAELRSQFAALNSPVFDYLLGTANTLPAAVRANKGATLERRADGSVFRPEGQDSDDQRSADLLNLFWSPTFATRIATDLSQMSNIGSEHELMLLACNLPSRTVRRELRLAMNRQWNDGKTPFEAARLNFDSIRDPGFLLLVKSMPREDPPPPPVRPKKSSVSAPPPSAEKKTKYAWMAAVENFVGALNTRFYAVGRTQRSEADAFPIPLHKGGTVAAEFHLQWPGWLKVKPTETEIEPLILHYVRIEGEDRLTRLVDFYKRHAGGAVHTTAKGEWIDAVQRLSEEDKVRSIDVMISREDAKPRSNTASENLIVEVLTIEILDPSITRHTLTESAQSR